MKDYGLVSIITPSYNSDQFIGKTIESVMAQTYPNWELLITDDRSSDGSCELIMRYVQEDKRVHLYQLAQNSGAGVARNNSIKRARGRYIAFLDSDDRWYPEKLERQLAFMADNGYELTFTSYDICNEEGEVVQPLKCPKRISYFQLLCANKIGCLTCIYDTKRIGKRYMNELRKRQDWGLWLDIIKETKYAYGLQEVLAIYRDRSKSISSNKVAMLKYNFQLYHKVEKFSRPTSFILLSCFFLPYYLYDRLRSRWLRKALAKVKK